MNRSLRVLPLSALAAQAAVARAGKHGMPGVPDPVLSAGGQVTIPGIFDGNRVEVCSSRLEPGMRVEAPSS